MNLALATIGAAAAVAAAVAAVGSWNAVTKANASAETLAAIERGRRHDELCPEFGITCTIRDTTLTSADLHIALKPSDLGHLDEVTVTVLDEAGVDHWAHGLPDGVTPEEAEAFVWGPWEFNTGASAQVVSNRTTRPRSYTLVTGKNWDLLSMRHIQPGRWMTGTSPEQWRKQYVGKPIRLLLTCRCEPFEPWAVLYEAPAELERKASVRTI